MSSSFMATACNGISICYAPRMCGIGTSINLFVLLTYGALSSSSLTCSCAGTRIAKGPCKGNDLLCPEIPRRFAYRQVLVTNLFRFFQFYFLNLYDHNLPFLDPPLFSLNFLLRNRLPVNMEPAVYRACMEVGHRYLDKSLEVCVLHFMEHSLLNELI